MGVLLNRVFNVDWIADGRHWRPNAPYTYTVNASIKLQKIPLYAIVGSNLQTDKVFLREV